MFASRRTFALGCGVSVLARVARFAALSVAPLLAGAQPDSNGIQANEGRSADLSRVGSMDVEGLDPTLANILESYYERTFGGLDNWEALESVRFDGTLHTPQGSLKFIVFKKKPNLCKVEIILSPDVSSFMGYDGRDAWTFNPTVDAGPQTMDSVTAEAFIRDATIGGHLLYPRLEGKRLEINGTTIIEGHRCYQIEVTLPGGEQMTSFLDMGDQVERRVVTIDAESGREKVDTRYEFETFAGVQFPVVSVSLLGGEPLHRVEISEIRTNLGMTDWMFARPETAVVEKEEAPEPLLPVLGETAFPEPRTL